MALINCPECGRTNISDTAEQCPECGYNVKEHFEREERKKLREEQIQQRELKKQQAIEDLKPELERKLKEIDNMPYPQKPSFFEMLFDGKHNGGVFIGSLIAGMFCCMINIFLGILFLFAAACLLLVMIIDFCGEKERYNNIISDWQGYKQRQKKIIKDNYKSYADNLADYGKREAPEYKFPISTEKSSTMLKCPICGSASVKKISTMNRTVSVATVGLASSKIGKQYECKDCKHKW